MENSKPLDWESELGSWGLAHEKGTVCFVSTGQFAEVPFGHQFPPS